MLFDTHCHLNYEGLAEREADVVSRARENGVSRMISISTRESEWEAVIGGAERHADVWATVGIHPHEADEHPDISTAKLVDAAAHPRVVGIGETGLDYYYDRSDRARQQLSFRSHIAAARQTQLPLVVHTRNAEEDTAAILAEEMGKGAFPMVIHCFTSSQWLADACLELGAYISLSGILTFRNAADLREVARRLPEDRMLVETDSPFLAPVPMRGKVCEPAFVRYTAECLAGVRETDLDSIAAVTSANAERLFSRVRG